MISQTAKLSYADLKSILSTGLIGLLAGSVYELLRKFLVQKRLLQDDPLLETFEHIKGNVVLHHMLHQLHQATEATAAKPHFMRLLGETEILIGVRHMLMEVRDKSIHGLSVKSGMERVILMSKYRDVGRTYFARAVQSLEQIMTIAKDGFSARSVVQVHHLSTIVRREFDKYIEDVLNLTAG